MPRLTRAHYRRELVAWVFLPMMMGAVEGGVVSVIAKNAFAGAVPDRWLNIAVAILTAAPAFSNVTSFLWSSLSHGRHKIRFLVALQLLAVILIAQVGFAPRSGLGLAMLVVAAAGSRICWSGVVTLRSMVWRANYPRAERARMAGKLAAVQAIMLASVGLILALAMEANAGAFNLLFPLAASCGLIGALIYGRMRMRGHAALVAGERRDTDEQGSGVGLRGLRRVLKDDRLFRGYMGWMFVFGIGNLAISAPLVIILRDVFGFGYLAGIMIMSTIPIAVMPLVIPAWSRLLDRTHIIRFRVIHSWAFVATTTVFLIGAVAHIPALLWIGAVLKGIAIGGGVLGWNLGQLDFGPPKDTAHYMGVHVTLTGIRGLIGPPLAYALYELLNTWHPGSGPWVFAVCLGLNLIGAFGFLHLSRHLPEKKVSGTFSSPTPGRAGVSRRKGS